ncbi:MAG: hypothetical protein H7A41_04195 [Chlamydiales bacterium]|nr:hypothetical protein [Chlamydiales bacterium]
MSCIQESSYANEVNDAFIASQNMVPSPADDFRILAKEINSANYYSFSNEELARWLDTLEKIKASVTDHIKENIMDGITADAFNELLSIDVSEYEDDVKKHSPEELFKLIQDHIEHCADRFEAITPAKIEILLLELQTLQQYEK